MNYQNEHILKELQAIFPEQRFEINHSRNFRNRDDEIINIYNPITERWNMILYFDISIFSGPYGGYKLTPQMIRKTKNKIKNFHKSTQNRKKFIERTLKVLSEMTKHKAIIDTNNYPNNVHGLYEPDIWPMSYGFRFDIIPTEFNIDGIKSFRKSFDIKYEDLSVIDTDFLIEMKLKLKLRRTMGLNAIANNPMDYDLSYVKSNCQVERWEEGMAIIDKELIKRNSALAELTAILE